MRTSRWVLSLSLLVACGPDGGGKGAATVPSPTPSGSSSASPTPSPSSSSSANVPPAPATSGTTAPVAPPKGAMKPIAPSQMAMKLRDIGLDPAALPPLNKLDPKTLRDVMNTFTRSLGVQCNHCHEKDFRAPTANKTIATHMWNDFTRSLALDGAPLYCDSCHGGHPEILDRSDLKAIGGWMQTNYVDKLTRADKKDHGCETCHGDPFEGKILKRWK